MCPRRCGRTTLWTYLPSWPHGSQARAGLGGMGAGGAWTHKLLQHTLGTGESATKSDAADGLANKLKSRFISIAIKPASRNPCAKPCRAGRTGGDAGHYARSAPPAGQQSQRAACRPCTRELAACLPCMLRLCIAAGFAGALGKLPACDNLEQTCRACTPMHQLLPECSRAQTAAEVVPLVASLVELERQVYHSREVIEGEAGGLPGEPTAAAQGLGHKYAARHTVACAHSCALAAAPDA